MNAQFNTTRQMFDPRDAAEYHEASYEIDFAAQIVADCAALGVPAGQAHDCGICTSSDPSRYYSYRLEKGRTGRMFGFIGWA